MSLAYLPTGKREREGSGYLTLVKKGLASKKGGSRSCSNSGRLDQDTGNCCLGAGVVHRQPRSRVGMPRRPDGVLDAATHFYIVCPPFVEKPVNERIFAAAYASP